MASNRKVIPKATEERVLDEYNHRCAMCGSDKPQIHHIDADPSNNDPMNLLPLCPNCHLTGQHNPAAPVDPGRLSLFRRYKDPTILTPEFAPVFVRLRFLDEVDDPRVGCDILRKRAKELEDFISALEMGLFYAKRVHELVRERLVPRAWFRRTPPKELEEQRIQDEKRYKEGLRQNREAVIGLVVEMLRYQPWQKKPRQDREQPPR